MAPPGCAFAPDPVYPELIHVDTASLYGALLGHDHKGAGAGTATAAPTTSASTAAVATSTASPRTAAEAVKIKTHPSGAGSGRGSSGSVGGELGAGAPPSFLSSSLSPGAKIWGQ